MTAENNAKNHPWVATWIDWDNSLPAWTGIGAITYAARKAFDLDNFLADPEVIDENIIQRMLFMAADLIKDKASFNHDGLGILNTTEVLDSSKKLQVLRHQAQLLSDSIIPSGEIAKDLFSDNATSESIETEYYIKNYIIMNLYNEDRGLYYFDIDEVNNTNIGRFFISKVIIKNKSTSSYTLKANYQISLKINFTSFEDLMFDNVKAYKVGASNITTQIPIIYLLYKFMKQTDLPPELRDAVDKSGVIFNQTLFMKNTDRFKKFNDTLGDTISKNYHLSYHKHNFEVFKESSPFYKYYENELIIDYIAFESPDMTKEERAAMNVPTPNANLYEIALSEADFDTIKASQDIVTALSEQLALCGSDSGLSTDYLNQLKKSVEEQEKKLKAMINDYNYSLIFSILNTCKRYKINGITKKILNIYSASNAREALAELIKPTWVLGMAASAVSVFTGVGTAGGVIGLGIGAYQIISAISSKKLVSKSLSYSIVRDVFQNITVSEQDIGSGDLLKAKLASDMTDDASEEFYEDEETAKERVELVFLKYAFSTSLPNETDLDTELPLYFTTFGEVLKIIKSLATKLGIVVGGYTIDSPDSNIKFVNFADIPITIKNLTRFLYNNIQKTNRGFRYDTEVFLRDIYENLIKNIIYDGASVLQSKSITISKNIKIKSTLHHKREDLFSSTKKINLLTATEIEDYKKQFFLTKNFNFRTSDGNINNNLYTVYVIGAIEEARLINFYQDFFNKNPGEVALNTDKFQNYICTNHIMPCILSKKISTTESILKTKYLSFSRYDNSNLQTGNLLNGYGQLRMPYKVKGEMKAFMPFFIDLGSMFFVAPPTITQERLINMFGYGGLYSIIDSQFEYVFQSLSGDKITIPAFDSKYIFDGMVISPGDVVESGEASRAAAARRSESCSANLLGTMTAENRSDYTFFQGVKDTVVSVFTGEDAGKRRVASTVPNVSAIEAYLRRSRS